MLNNIKDKGRFIGAIVYIIFAILIISTLLLCRGFNFVFYNNAINNFQNYPRFLWCLAWSFIGFSFIAYEISRISPLNGRGKAFPDYYTIYFIILMGSASLVFAFLHIFDKASNYLFYFFAAPISFMVGYNVDVIRWRILDLIKKI